nr:helix-hairpin-helix domain-containing protein [Bacteroidota bacterium]
MSKFKQHIKDYFYISKMQRTASLIVFALILIVIAIFYTLPYLIKFDIYDYSKSLKEVNAFLSSRPHLSTSNSEITPFHFDPNNVTEEQLLEMGLTEKQTETFLNYRYAGGRFFKKSDVNKLYSISDSLYNILEPYIDIKKNEFDKPVEEAAEYRIDDELYVFDPNSMNKKDWRDIGLSDRQAGVIVNFMNAGGKFEVKEDLKAVYSITEKDYKRLERYIDLPYRSDVKKGIKKDDPEIFVVEINSADSSELVKLKGIGPSFAKRIIKYRELLGGYYENDQLMEVFGMDTTRFYGFVHQVKIDKNKLGKLDINKATFKDLLRHPYLEYYMVKSIFDYKEDKGNFSSVAELRNIGLIYDELYEKISPYLTTGETNQ